MDALMLQRKELAMAFESALLAEDEAKSNELWAVANELEDAWGSVKNECFESKNVATLYAWDLVDMFYYIPAEKIIGMLKVLDYEVVA